jgi:cholesterol oxidase
MSVAAGAGVGGGSLVYANVSCVPPDSAFAHGWPAEITAAELAGYFDRVGDFMEVQTVPDNQWTPRMTLMRDAANAAGFGNRFKKLELAVRFDPQWPYATHTAGDTAASKPVTNKHGAPQGTCVHLGNCDIGCDVRARNTLDLNYLYVAENRHGVDVRPLHLVDVIEPLSDGSYRVHYDNIVSGQRVAGYEVGKRVILAAGSLGSTELLLRNRDIHQTLPDVSGFLGKNWSSNGDFLTPAFYPHRAPQPSTGPTIASAIDFQDASQGGQTFWIEDGGFPNLLSSYLLNKSRDPAISFRFKLVLQSLQQFCRNANAFENIMPWFAQGLDAGNGVLGLTPSGPGPGDGRLRLQWDVAQSQAVIERIIDMHKRLAERTGGVPLVPPTWSLSRDLITPHPLGGCCAGNTANDGVVNHAGEVFNYPRLFVIDGAMIPRPIGVNPSRTIAALAERCSHLMVHEH